MHVSDTGRNRLLDSDVHMQRLPSSDNEVGVEIQERMWGSGMANMSFASQTVSFFGTEIKRVHSVRSSSAAYPGPLDGIEDDNGLLFAGHGGLVGDIGGGITNFFLGVSMFAPPILRPEWQYLQQVSDD